MYKLTAGIDGSAQLQCTQVDFARSSQVSENIILLASLSYRTPQEVVVWIQCE
jgi:hypothetical protein